MSISAYVINLDREQDRLRHFRGQWTFPIGIERIAAVDGREWSDQAVDEFGASSPRARGWMRGQIGCFLSHRNAWSAIADSAGEFGAVFEDDIHISAELGEFLADSSWIPENADIVRLETTGQLVRLGKKHPSLRGRNVAQVTGDAWGTGAYIIRSETARLLANVPPRWFRPSDYFLYCGGDSAIARALTVYQLTPSVVVQDKFVANAGAAGFGSGIEQGQSGSTDSFKAFLRPALALLTNRSLVRYRA